MEMIAGAGLVRTNYYYSGIDLGKGGTGSYSSSWCKCGDKFFRTSTLKSSAKSTTSAAGGSDFFSNLLIGDSQFPAQAPPSLHGATRHITAAAATGNGAAFTGGNSRAEDINEALSTVLPHALLEKDSAAFRAILAAIASVALAAENQRRHDVFSDKTEVPVDALRQGRLVESRLVYRQTFVIRSYEIGADRTASIETMMNHFQVIGHSVLSFCSHSWQFGGDGQLAHLVHLSVLHVE